MGLWLFAHQPIRAQNHFPIKNFVSYVCTHLDSSKICHKHCDKISNIDPSVVKRSVRCVVNSKTPNGCGRRRGALWVRARRLFIFVWLLCWKCHPCCLHADVWLARWLKNAGPRACAWVCIYRSVFLQTTQNSRTVKLRRKVFHLTGNWRLIIVKRRWGGTEEHSVFALIKQFSCFLLHLMDVDLKFSNISMFKRLGVKLQTISIRTVLNFNISSDSYQKRLFFSSPQRKESLFHKNPENVSV